MNICLAYNVKPEVNPVEIGKSSSLDFDLPETIDLIEKHIELAGHKVVRLEADGKAFFKLEKLKNQIDLVFNIAEGLGGDARESQIPLFCEMLKIPYTHSSPTVHAISLDKNFSKMIVKSLGIKVPDSILIDRDSDLSALDFTFPLIVKPNSEGSSIGVFDTNVVPNKKELEKAVNVMYSNGLSSSLLLEQFIDGREFTVALINDEKLRVLPIIEQRFDFLPKGYKNIAGFELKWRFEDSLKNLEEAYYCPAPIDEKLKNEIKNTSLSIFEALNIKDCARIDYRLDTEGNLYFIEVNTLPGINLNENVVSYFVLAARKAGISSTELIKKIINSACRRYNLKHKVLSFNDAGTN